MAGPARGVEGPPSSFWESLFGQNQRKGKKSKISGAYAKLSSEQKEEKKLDQGKVKKKEPSEKDKRIKGLWKKKTPSRLDLSSQKRKNEDDFSPPSGLKRQKSESDLHERQRIESNLLNPPKSESDLLKLQRVRSADASGEGPSSPSQEEMLSLEEALKDIEPRKNKAERPKTPTPEKQLAKKR